MTPGYFGTITRTPWPFVTLTAPPSDSVTLLAATRISVRPDPVVICSRTKFPVSVWPATIRFTPVPSTRTTNGPAGSLSVVVVVPQGEDAVHRQGRAVDRQRELAPEAEARHTNASGPVIWRATPADVTRMSALSDRPVACVVAEVHQPAAQAEARHSRCRS